MANYLDKTGLIKVIETLKTKLNKKVDKVTGKDLSSNDFTDDYKNKIDNIEDDALVIHELPVGSIIGFDGTQVPDGWEVVEDNGDNSNPSVGNFTITKYKLIIEEDSAKGAEVLLPGNYKVGGKCLAVYLNGERLVLSTDATGTDGHYIEVGTEGAESNKIQLTSDWNLAAGDILEVVIEVSGVSEVIESTSQKAVVATAHLTENKTFTTTEKWVAIPVKFDNMNEVDGLTLNSNGGIVIGKGISKILVSCNVSIVEAMGCLLTLVIRKNNNIVAKRVFSHDDETYINLSMLPQLIEVTEGDVITITFNCTQVISETKTIEATATYLTIQAVTPLIEDNNSTGGTTIVNTEEIIVNSIEPTGDNRKKVWIQKGNNLLNIKNAKVGTIIDTTTKKETISETGACGKDYIKVRPNTTYTLTTHLPCAFINLFEYGEEKEFIKQDNYTNSDVATVTTGTNTYYLKWSFDFDGETPIDEDFLENFEMVLAQGSTPVYGESYIEPTIFVKNSNDVYEAVILEGEIFVTQEGNYVTKDYVDNLVAGINGYTLPIASSTTLGGIKVGNGLSVGADGTLQVVGGTGDGNGSGDYVLNNVFYWDGLSSTTNSENLSLWQQIVSAAQSASVLVICEKEPYRTVFMLDSNNTTQTNGEKTLTGITQYLSSSSDNLVGIGINYADIKVTLTFENSVITSVSAVKSEPDVPYKFLPTNSTEITQYEPTYDYHPATKKYVDDLVGNINSILATLTNVD